MGRIIEGYWDCPYCGEKRILGRFRDCPSCGKPRGENTVFQHDLPNEENIVENPEETSREADWYCEFCDSLNPASAKFCESCGSPRTEKTYFEMKEEHSKKEEAAQAIAAPPPQPEPKRRSRLPLLLFIAAAIALLFFLLIDILAISGLFVWHRSKCKAEQPLLEQKIGTPVTVDGKTMYVYSEGEGAHTFVLRWKSSGPSGNPPGRCLPAAESMTRSRKSRPIPRSWTTMRPGSGRWPKTI